MAVVSTLLVKAKQDILNPLRVISDLRDRNEADHDNFIEI